MKRFLPLLLPALLLAAPAALAQKGPPCDPSLAPVNLQATYTPGTGAQLSWDPIDGSLGVRLLATTPGGASVSRTIVGFEPSAYLVPDAVLGTGVYVWRVLATCTTTPPYATTPVSAPDTFTVGAPLTCPASVTDASGNAYGVVRIGAQCWMAENLRAEAYVNGDPLPVGVTGGSWSATTGGAARAYADNAANIPLYGLLYNHFATTDARNVCPAGWHVPSLAEWDQLDLFLGGPAPSANVGGQLRATGDNAAGTGLWNAPNDGATNGTGFGAVPGGLMLINGASLNLGSRGQYWATDLDAFGNGQGRSLANAEFGSSLGLFSNARNGGGSIRCVRD